VRTVKNFKIETTHGRIELSTTRNSHPLKTVDTRSLTHTLGQ